MKDREGTATVDQGYKTSATVHSSVLHPLTLSVYDTMRLQQHGAATLHTLFSRFFVWTVGMPSRVALITGAGSGIGRATAIELARRGWGLVLVGRTESKLEETNELISRAITEPVDFISTPVDLAEPDMAEAVIEGIEEFWGRLDGLINNAGHAEWTALPDIADEQVRAMFEINTFAPLRLIRAAWGLFERTVREDPDARPAVVNISSMSTVDPFPGLGVYGMSKAALEASARAIRSERDALPLRAFNIAPGAVETPMIRERFDEEALPPAHTLDPAEVAAEITACLEGERDDREGQTILLPSP